MADTRNRSAREVFEDHLWQGKHGSVEEDFERNYAEDVVVLTGRGAYRGREGLEHLAGVLREVLPYGTFEYRTRLVEGEAAFLEWTALSESAKVEDDADSFFVRDGRIVAQTIHYTVEPLGDEQEKAGER